MAIDRVNVISQKNNISIDIVMNQLKGLIKIIEKFREECIGEILNELNQKATVIYKTSTFSHFCNIFKHDFVFN